MLPPSCVTLVRGERTARILDGVDDNRISDAAKDLIEKADPSDLGVLAHEMGPYLEARAQRLASSRDRERLINAYTAQIEAAIEKAVPMYADAKRQQQAAQQALTVAEYNQRSFHEHLANGVNGTYARPVLVDPSRYDPDSGGE
jgi:hypothetical protein